MATGEKKSWLGSCSQRQYSQVKPTKIEHSLSKLVESPCSKSEIGLRVSASKDFRLYFRISDLIPRGNFSSKFKPEHFALNCNNLILLVFEITDVLVESHMKICNNAILVLLYTYLIHHPFLCVFFCFLSVYYIFFLIPYFCFFLLYLLIPFSNTCFVSLFVCIIV